MADLQSTLLGFSDGHRDRFESEMENLSQIESALLVVECTKEDFLKHAPDYGKKSPELNAKILYRSVLAIAQDYRVQVEWSGSRRMAEIDCFRWLYRFWEKKLKPAEKARKIWKGLIVGCRQPKLCKDCEKHWLSHFRKPSRCLSFDPEESCPEYNDKLNQIARALEEYQAALKRREHGEVAAWKFKDKCEAILEV